MKESIPREIAFRRKFFELSKTVDLHEVMSTQNLQGLQEQINQLRDELQREKQDREKIVLWIKDNLGPNLENVKKMITDMNQTNNKQKENTFSPPGNNFSLQQTL